MTVRALGVPTVQERDLSTHVLTPGTMRSVAVELQLGDALVKKIGVAVVLGLTLAGCVSAKQQEEYAQLEANSQRAVAACEADLAAKKTSHAAYGRCLTNAQAHLLSGDNIDLKMMLVAKRAAILEQVDRKQLTFAQGNAEVAQLVVAIKSEIQRRDNAAQAVAAQQMAATTAITVATKPVFCHRVGNFVNCF